jgi:serine/threonine protein kinase
MRHEKLTVGGFGDIYAATNSEGAPQILKYVEPSDRYGLESIVELYIMKYIVHPSINELVHCNVDGAVSIIQHRAVGDASSIIKHKKFRPNEDVLRRWLWQVACGVAVLHNNNILHGDIKAANILLFFKEGSSRKEEMSKHNCSKHFNVMDAKLNDFSLSRLIMDPNIGTKDMGYFSYTATHRSIEVWKGINYGFPADIWALGCTFYEIVYAESLFKSSEDKSKIIKRASYLKAFDEWTQANVNIVLPHSAPLPSSVPFSGVEGRNKGYNLSKDWNMNDPLLNDLILGMLNVNPLKRYTIAEVINHQYFDLCRQGVPMKVENPVIISYEYPAELQPTIDKCLKLVNDLDVAKLALFMTRAVSYLDRSDLLPTAIILAHKILYRAPPKNFEMNETSLHNESLLITALKYKTI